MPEFRNLAVRVIDCAGNEFQEWGLQHLQSQNKISAYIKSSTDMTFHVTLQPILPFQDLDLPTARDGDYDMGEASLGKGKHHDLRAKTHFNPISKKELRSHVHTNISSNHQRAGSDEHYYTKHGRTRHGVAKNKDSIPSPIPQRIEGTCPPPPYHFLVSLFLDGRQKAERQAIIYLDPLNEDFAQPDGKIKLQSRWVQGMDGNMKEKFWVFKDVGIETAFDQMLIDIGRDSSRNGDMKEKDEDAVIAAMNATALGAEEGVKKDEKTSIGQIVVVIRRVTVGPKWLDDRYQPPHKEGEADDVDMSGAMNEISHTTGLEHVRTLPSRPVRVASYHAYIEGEKPYATFQFFYRSQETLEKFGFPGLARISSTPTKNLRHLEDKMANITPLSITHSLPRFKRKGRSFEENIKEANLRIEEPESPNSAPLPKRKQPMLTFSQISRQLSPPIPAFMPSLPECRASKVNNPGSASVSVDSYSGSSTSFSASDRPNSGAEKGPSHLQSSVSVDSYSGSSTSFSASDRPNSGAEKGPSHLQSSGLDCISKKSLAELDEIPNKECRISSQSSEADDERDASDMETVRGGDDEPDDTDAMENQENIPPDRVDQDDQGLSTALQDRLTINGEKYRISRRSCSDGDRSDEGSSSTAVLKRQETMKTELPSISPLLLLSAVAEEADEEDNAASSVEPARS